MTLLFKKNCETFKLKKSIHYKFQLNNQTKDDSVVNRTWMNKHTHVFHWSRIMPFIYWKRKRYWSDIFNNPDYFTHLLTNPDLIKRLLNTCLANNIQYCILIDFHRTAIIAICSHLESDWLSNECTSKSGSVCHTTILDWFI